jgi:transcriptional regulator with XRE-family HTH domain
MVSPSLLVEARRRAGLSQRELAARAGVAQQEIARYERGRVTPSLERLRRLIAACGLELTFGLARADASYDEAIAAALAIAPAQRLAGAMRDAGAVRLARAQAAGEPPPVPVDPIGALATLEDARVHYVLIGELAEVLHASPLLPLTGTVMIVPRAGERRALDAAIALGRGTEASPPTRRSLDAIERWHLHAFAAELAIAPAPAGTHGYEDLHRNAARLGIGKRNLGVSVASLVDLVRIAQASDDRSRLPALRRTLELANATAAGGSARAA